MYVLGLDIRQERKKRIIEHLLNDPNQKKIENNFSYLNFS